MAEAIVARHLAAITRVGLSRPVRLTLEAGLINRKTTLLDYGCGRASDISRLKQQGVKCFGWDPVLRPRGKLAPADVVNLGYVVNVIEDVRERADTLRRAWDLAKGLLIVSARLTYDQPDSPGSSYGDGYVTRLGTFQKFYKQHELREWVDAVLAAQSVAASPGVFYVFRDPTARERFLQSRYRRRAAAPRQSVRDKLFEEHRTLLEPLMGFFDTRGRLPAAGEVEEVPAILEALGSLKVAFQVVKHATGEERWTAVRKDRTKDLLVYLALSRFGGRPRFSELPEETRLDIKALLSTYNRACTYADELLFMAGKMDEVDAACRQSKIGKQTPAALYVHRSALEELHPLLRVYEGCARVLVGEVEGANIVKLRRDEPRVTYLRYPTFDKDAHPVLHSAEHVNLRTLDVDHLSYEDSNNPPILHRKEEFVAVGYSLRNRFEHLTKQEEQQGLFVDTAAIGTSLGWSGVLSEKGLCLRGHRLVRAAR